jgi:hypothetical protein
VFESQPPRNRKLYAGDKVSALVQDFYPQNTIEVNGESFYKVQLSNVARALEVRSDYFHQVEAFVKLEPENPYDKNAVAVYVHDEKVGYVNRNDAPVFQEALKDIHGQAWVMAAIKHVTEIDQYRVRLMVQVPVTLDPRAYPLIDLSALEEVELEKAGIGWGGIRRFFLAKRISGARERHSVRRPSNGPLDLRQQPRRIISSQDGRCRHHHQGV